jgi:hypothetical protein
MTFIDRYHEALTNIPPPGCGCHPALLSVANYGFMAGLGPQRIHDDIRGSIPTGTRRIPDREITDAVNKALADHNSGTFTPRPRPEPIMKDGKAARERIINQAVISNEVDLWESSPIRLWDNPENDPELFLSTMFEAEDLLYIGERYEAGVMGQNIRPMCDWITAHHRGAKLGPFIIVNPLSGFPAEKKAGGLSLRCDACVVKFTHTLGEFDEIGKEEQIRFWTAVKLPIKALIDSGGKSVHAWIDIKKLTKVDNADEWNREIRHRFYEHGLEPLGVDSSCKNETRLSRMPGYLRKEKQAWQRLLWLSPEGRPIC